MTKGNRKKDEVAKRNKERVDHALKVLGLK